MQPRVFITEQLNRIELANLRDYGQITYLYKYGTRQVKIFSEAFQESILDIANDELGFNPEIDYFAVTGSTAPSVIALSELIAYFGEIRTLLYNGDKYLVVNLGLPYDNELPETKLGELTDDYRSKGNLSAGVGITYSATYEGFGVDGEGRTAESSRID